MRAVREKNQLLSQLYDLAKARNEVSNKNLNRYTINEENFTVSDPVQVYLLKLSIDELKMILTIMYMGREKDYRDYETPKEYYSHTYNYLSNNGWGSRELLAERISEKRPLDTYIKDGCYAMGVLLEA